MLTLRDGLTLTVEAADSWARAEARVGRQLDVNRSLADYATQLRLWLAWEAYRTGKGPWAPRALHPLYSMHVRGLAVDSDDGYNPAVVDLLAEHGWIRTAPDEAWHFDYLPYRDKYRGEGMPGTSGAVAFPVLTKASNDMQMYLREGDDCPKPGTVHFFAPGTDFAFTSLGQYKTNRNQISAYRKAGATNLIEPPADPLGVPTVNRSTLNSFRVNYFGLKAV